MTALAIDDRQDLRRWLACAAIVLCAHAAIVVSLMQWREPIGEGNFGDDVILLELRPEQIQAEPTPDKPVEQAEQKPDPLPQQPSEVMVAPQAPVPQLQAPPQEERPPAPATSAAQAARTRAGRASWQSEISVLLEHNKRYPEQARARHQEGVAQVAFSIDRGGHLLSSRLVKGSGFSELDEEALALLQRSHFPPPPPDVTGDEIKFLVPVRFSLR
jgi:periplasmic protein TonB